MIQKQTKLKVADNSGAKEVMCINVIGVSRKTVAQLGDVITMSIKAAAPRAQVKKKEIHRGVIVRQVKPFRRPDGSVVRFDENAVVLIDDDKQPKGTRVFGPVAREVRDRGYIKIISMAQEVV